MNTADFKRDDWLVIGLAVVLVIDLIAIPWFSFGSGTVLGYHYSNTFTATGYPDGWIGVLALLFALAVGVDLAIERLSPKTTLPNIGGSRTMTRFWLAVIAAGFLALKFVLHIHFSDFSFGFIIAVVVAAGLVFTTWKLSKDQSVLPSQSGPASV
jgi:hypothetical protein